MKRRFIYGILGYMLTGAASGLFIYCGLSADCFNTLVQGVAPFLRLSVGMSSCVLQMAMLLLVVLLGGRRYAGVGTVAGPVIITADISFFGAALSPVLLAAPLAVRMLLILLATILVALGLAFIQESKLGSAANDILPILLSERLPKLQFRTIRVLFDCVELVIGVLLGSSFGFGTVCAAFLIGPLLQLSLHLLERPMYFARKNISREILSCPARLDGEVLSRQSTGGHRGSRPGCIPHNAEKRPIPSNSPGSVGSEHLRARLAGRSLPQRWC